MLGKEERDKILWGNVWMWRGGMSLGICGLIVGVQDLKSSLPSSFFSSIFLSLLPRNPRRSVRLALLIGMATLAKF